MMLSKVLSVWVKQVEKKQHPDGLFSFYLLGTITDAPSLWFLLSVNPWTNETGWWRCGGARLGSERLCGGADMACRASVRQGRTQMREDWWITVVKHIHPHACAQHIRSSVFKSVCLLLSSWSLHRFGFCPSDDLDASQLCVAVYNRCYIEYIHI